MNINIPPPNTPLVDNRGKLTPEWYRYLANLNKSASDAAGGEVQAGAGLTGGGFVASGVTIDVATGGITSAMIRPSAALSVMGRQFGTGGAIADITADADNRVLSREGGLLAFRSFINGVSIGPTTAAPVVRTDSLELTATPPTSTATVSHSIPIETAGGTYHILLSATP